MNTEKGEEVYIENQKGITNGPYRVINEDPQFNVIFDEEMDPSFLAKGDILVRQFGNNKVEKRQIIAVSIVNIGIAAYLELLAPKRISQTDKLVPYVQYPDSPIGIFEKNIELRPGSKIMGGRNSGFYDNYGVILESIYTGGDPNKFEDWAYHVAAHSYGEFITSWILLDHIGFGVSEPTSITDIGMKSNISLDEALKEGEQELFEYFFHNPEKISQLSPEQFELFISSIYKNLGFSVEPIGAWNQPDGGVDIIAVAKTFADTEFRLAIQCKTSKNKISVKPIRELAGVLDYFKAHQGVVVSTSRFTSSARDEAEGHLWKISLQDIDNIQEKIISILMPKFRKILSNSKKNI